MDDSAESNSGEWNAGGRGWLLLIHQIPPKPDYLRVKVRRRLHKLGAVPLKQSVYLLPNRPEAREDFQWLREEIQGDGGEATLSEAAFLSGVTDADLEELFHRDREARYSEIAAEAQGRAHGEAGHADPRELESLLRRLRVRLDEVVAMDYFASPHREKAESAIAALETRLQQADGRPLEPDADAGSLIGRVWVTRKDVHADRIASAWLIRRFVDAEARFRFVPERGYHPEPGELRFDMYAAEFTHEGDRCTFETLLERIRPADAALRAVSEVVHEIDLKDEKFARPETAGVDRLIDGIAAGSRGDDERLDRGAILLEALYRSFGGAA
jgi:hypothetical protein